MKSKYLFIPIILLIGFFNVRAQDLSQIQSSPKPLVLESIGSFYVGGESEMQSKSELGDFAPEGHVTNGQMYVQFMKPYEKASNTSLVLIHGMTLTGKTYETTPDGRMGWNEYFVRKGYDTYVVDQFGVGRSGFDSKIYNQVRSGQAKPDEQPVLIRIPDENVLLNFRIESITDGRFKDARLASESYGEFSKQGVPFRPVTTETDLLQNYRNFSTLSSKIKNTILVSHSQSGPFPISTALLDTVGIKGAVLIEPAPAEFSDEDAKRIVNIPFVVIYGDHLGNNTGMDHTWGQLYTTWVNFIEKVNKAGGNATMLYLPDLGIKGNGHMLMQEDNNLEIADLILNWVNTLQ